MSEFYHNEKNFNVWRYPDVEEKLDREPVLLETKIPVENIEQSDAQNEPEPPPPNLELTKRLTYLDAIAHDLNAYVTQIDRELLMCLVRVIKKTVKKIILKELQHDESLLPQMIDETLSLLSQLEGCQLYVSEKDYACFTDKEIMPAQITIKTDKTLEPGDFIIKSKHNQIEAILSDRLDALFGT
ncbi:FliH/SctL family protein [Legionella nagasakiensis]|uniref:FliH/SctL family protein n=1 Tax=Legionella nagasakiensis TaxID=535290 RepID=UPI0010564585|nr:FliH/SctL family protein [Legionella nagasakiensis]